MKTILKTLIPFFICLPITVCADETILLPGYTPEEVTMKLDKTSLTEIEGIWRFMPDGAAVTIERVGVETPITKYIMIMTESVDDDVDEGTVLGYVYPTADAQKFTAKLFTDIHGHISSKPKKFELTLSDKGHLNFTASSNKVRLDFWRWLPYLFRVSVVRDKTSNIGTNGCVKIFPATPEAMQGPRYL